MKLLWNWSGEKNHILLSYIGFTRQGQISNPIITLLRKSKNRWFMSTINVIIPITRKELITFINILENIDKFSLTFP